MMEPDVLLYDVESLRFEGGFLWFFLLYIVFTSGGPS